MSKAGKQFEKDMLVSLRSAGWWAERFRDNTWNPKGGAIAGSTESPPDMITVDREGNPLLVEMKAKLVPTLLRGSIDTNRCSGHQRERLLHFEQFGAGYVLVCFYTQRSQRRCAVMVPIGAWVAYERHHGSRSARLDVLRAYETCIHFKWVGRKADIGPYQLVKQLGLDPAEDVTIYD